MTLRLSLPEYLAKALVNLAFEVKTLQHSTMILHASLVYDGSRAGPLPNVADNASFWLQAGMSNTRGHGPHVPPLKSLLRTLV